MTPIILGRVPGERRTFEERLRSVLQSLQSKAEADAPNPLSRIPSLHLGDVMIIRPEHYLTYSELDARTYYPSRNGVGNIPLPIDQYKFFDPTVGTPLRREDTEENPYKFRSWLLTIVVFDGDPVAYLREIAEFIERDFDEVFENCEGYPYTADFEKFWDWVKRYQITPDVFYALYGNLGLARIKELEAFRRKFDEFVAMVRSPTGTRVRSMDELFDQFLRENQQYASGFPTPGGVYESDE